MILELVLAGASGIAFGVGCTAAYAAKLYGWHSADMAEPDAAAWRRGYQAGRKAGGVVVLKPGDDPAHPHGACLLLEPGAAPVHRTSREPGIYYQTMVDEDG